MKEFILSKIFKISLLSTLLLVVFQRCQTTSVEISSEPSGADVVYLDSDAKIFRNLGKTPVSLSSENEMHNAVISQDFVIIAVEKPGYIRETVLFEAKSHPKSTLTFNLKKAEVFETEIKGKIPSEELDAIIRSVQRISNQIKKRELDVAYNSISNLVSKYSEIPLLWEVKGSIELLKKETKEAVKSYKKSLALGSKNPETIDALAKLEGTPK